MKSPRVLYVMPVYNAEDWLVESVQSLLDQDYENIQILCVDDGSTDRSYSMLTKWSASEERLSCVSQKNAGPGAAFNVGLEYAQENGFEYIARMDADDVSFPCRTSLQVDVLETHINAAACSCSAEYFIGNTVEGKSVVSSSSNAIKDEIYAGGRGLIQGATLFRASALGSIGGYRAAKTPAEDTDIFLRLVDEYPLLNIAEVAYKIRICRASHSLDNVYFTRLYHHYYLYLSVLRKRGCNEIGFDEYKNQLSLLSRISVKRESLAIKAYFKWMIDRSRWALFLAALLEPGRTYRRIIKKCTTES